MSSVEREAQGIPEIPILHDYKARVLQVARRVKEQEDWCNEGFRQAMQELDIKVPRMPEPPLGSVVLHPSASRVFIRRFGGGWQRSGTNEIYTWDDVAAYCNDTPFLLLDTNGVSGYAKIREGGVEGITL